MIKFKSTRKKRRDTKLRWQRFNTTLIYLQAVLQKERERDRKIYTYKNMFGNCGLCILFQINKKYELHTHLVRRVSLIQPVALLAVIYLLIQFWSMSSS